MPKQPQLEHSQESVCPWPSNPDNGGNEIAAYVSKGYGADKRAVHDKVLEKRAPGRNLRSKSAKECHVSNSCSQVAHQHPTSSSLQNRADSILDNVSKSQRSYSSPSSFARTSNSGLNQPPALELDAEPPAMQTQNSTSEELSGIHGPTIQTLQDQPASLNSEGVDSCSGGAGGSEPEHSPLQVQQSQPTPNDCFSSLPEPSFIDAETAELCSKADKLHRELMELGHARNSPIPQTSDITEPLTFPTVPPTGFQPGECPQPIASTGAIVSQHTSSPSAHSNVSMLFTRQSSQRPSSPSRVLGARVAAASLAKSRPSTSPHPTKLVPTPSDSSPNRRSSASQLRRPACRSLDITGSLTASLSSTSLDTASGSRPGSSAVPRRSDGFAGISYNRPCSSLSSQRSKVPHAMRMWTTRATARPASSTFSPVTASTLSVRERDHDFAQPHYKPATINKAYVLSADCDDAQTFANCEHGRLPSAVQWPQPPVSHQQFESKSSQRFKAVMAKLQRHLGDIDSDGCSVVPPREQSIAELDPPPMLHPPAFLRTEALCWSAMNQPGPAHYPDPPTPADRSFHAQRGNRLFSAMSPYQSTVSMARCRSAVPTVMGSRGGQCVSSVGMDTKHMRGSVGEAGFTIRRVGLEVAGTRPPPLSR